MREKYIEQKLVSEVKKRGGICLKLASTGLDGIPDRLVLMAKGKIAFVELKAPKQKPRKLQLVRIKKLKELNEDIDYNIFKSTDNVNLNCILGTKKDGVYKSFLEDYDKEK